MFLKSRILRAINQQQQNTTTGVVGTHTTPNHTCGDTADGGNCNSPRARAQQPSPLELCHTANNNISTSCSIVPIIFLLSYISFFIFLFLKLYESKKKEWNIGTDCCKILSKQNLTCSILCSIVPLFHS